MTTIKLSGGDFGSEYMLVRCNLAQASAPIEFSSDGGEWSSTQYQCADARHTMDGLTEIGYQIAARELEIPEIDLECESEEIDFVPPSKSSIYNAATAID